MGRPKAEESKQEEDWLKQTEGGEPVNILMVTMSMAIGGAETHILELCRELVRTGDTVTLASYGGVYADRAVECGVKHVRLPLCRKDPVSLLKSYFGLKKLIRDGHFNLVHAHARIPAFLCGLLWRRLRVTDPEGRPDARFRFVTSAHLDFSVNALWRRTSQWGEYSMAVSEDIADYLVREYGFRRERIFLTINGIDTAKFSPETDPSPVIQQWDLDPAHRRIVCMSRLDADRADPAFRLLDAAERIENSFPGTDILIVGGGSEEEKLRHRASEVNGLVGRTMAVVTGPVTNTNEYCAAADIFVGVSRSALEAMSTARPVIVAGGQGALGIFEESVIPAAVETNFCCRGSALADADRLYRDVATLLSMTEAERRAMGWYNRRYIEEHYTVKRMANDYRRMYAAALAAPSLFFGKADTALSGYYGFGNLGDESLLSVMTASLAREIPGIRIAAFAKKPRAASRRTNLVCVGRLCPAGILRCLRGVKLLISGGGSLLQDATSRRSLGYYAGMLWLANRMGKKTAVYANGIGPVSNKRNRKMTARVTSSADWLSVRDGRSAEELKQLGVPEEKIRVTADPAFLIEPSGEDRLSRIRDKMGLHGTYFMISVRPLTGSGRQTESGSLTEENAAMLSEIASLAADTALRYRMTPVFVPMQTVQDALLSEKAAEMVRGHGEEALLYTPEDAQDLIGMMKGAAFVIGMRLHALIFASSAGVPIIGLTYDPKVSAMMEELDQPFTVNPRSPFKETAEGQIREILADRDRIGLVLTEKAGEMRDRCREDLLAVRSLLES